MIVSRLDGVPTRHLCAICVSYGARGAADSAPSMKAKSMRHQVGTSGLIHLNGFAIDIAGFMFVMTFHAANTRLQL